MANQNSGGEFFAGLVIGGLIGAAVALMLAPQSGEETRAQLMEKSDEWKTVAGESLADSRAKADAIVADARTRAESILAEARTKAAQVQEQAKEKAAKLPEVGKSAIDEHSSKLKDVASTIASKVKKGDGESDAPAEA